ncbi:VirK protein [Agrobacterium vitis]|nr:VirK protein [Agrobacterium vitis]
MFKSIVFASGLAFMAIFPRVADAATALTTLPDINAALKSGASVNSVVDLTKCTSATDPKKTGTMQGGLRISSFLIRPDQSLSFSDDHFTLTTKDKKPIYQFLRYQVKPDNSATFSMTTMEMPEMRAMGDALTYHCKVGEGLQFFEQ